MSKVKLLFIGKNKEQWLEEALSEYIKRLRPTLEIECVWVQNEAQLASLAAKERHVICLDPAGRLMDTPQFAAFFQKQFEESGARLTFVIGGAEGLDPDMRRNYPLVSLSPLTFTHQIARLVLIEQIYRATEILKGSKYHK